MPAKKDENASDGWTSVTFPAGRIEVTKVHLRTGEKPVLVSWDLFALESEELEALKRLRSVKRIGQERCTTLLRYGQYQLLQTEAPDVPQAELREAMRWRVKELVDFAIDQAVVDVLNIPSAKAEAGRASQVFVVAASHAQLTPRIRLFQEAKLPLQAIDIPELAQRNVAALFEQENRGLAVLTFDEDGGLLTLTYQGELLASRHIDTKRAELAAASEGAGGLYDRVLLEVQRSLDNFERAHSYATITRILVAALPGGNAFIDYLKANLYQPVEVLDLAQAMDVSAVPALTDPARQAEALLAIGAAMRSEAPIQ